MSATPQQDKLYVFLKATEEKNKQTKQQPRNKQTNYRAKEAEKNESKCSLILARAPMVRVQALFLKNTPGIFVRKKTPNKQKNKNAFAKSEKKDQTEKKKKNEFFSWTLPNLWDISEVIIEVWLIRQQ